ncbi:MAG: peptidylprolyl isomerase [Terriglobia bacterium]
MKLNRPTKPGPACARSASPGLRALLLPALCVLFAGLTFGQAPESKGVVVEEIITQVNDRIIVLSEYQRSLETLRQELAQQHQGAELETQFRERSQDVLRELIDQQLLAQKAAELGVSVETQVIRRLDEIRQQMNLPSMEALEQAATQQGINYEDFKQNIRDNFLTQGVINREVGARVQVTPAEISAYYEQHKQEFERKDGFRIQLMLVSTENKPEEELPALRTKAEEALAKARAGENFAELARQYSDDATAQSGGDAGFFERGSMAPEIERAVEALSRDQVSDLIQTRYGHMIVKLVERTAAGIPALPEVESRIQERLYLEKMQPALRVYLTQLRQESFISVKPGYTDTGKAPAQASAENP